MIIRENFLDRYLTATTRKANYTNNIFAKITLWKSKKDHDEGNSENSISIKNIYIENEFNIHKIIREIAHGIIIKGEVTK